jgi:CTP synthase
MTKNNNFTSGQVYYSVIERERKGEYLGKTVQVIPHITDEIKNRIIRNTSKYDIAIIEIGGTVGDIESLPFLEAVRQLKMELGQENAISVHMTLVPYLEAAKELKTKPTQNSVRQLMQIGIQADILICRAQRDIPEDVRKKISLFCNVPFNRVITALDTNTIYKLPLILYNQGLDSKILNIFRLDTLPPKLEHWYNIVENIENPKYTVKIALVGKYVDLTESYKSLNEALTHAGIENSTDVKIKYIDSEELEKYDDVKFFFDDVDGILVPGGFGYRGIEGKIKAVEYARINKIPFLGICLGMQIAVIEFARNIVKLEDANSTEFKDDCKNPVIDLMLEQKKVETLGATMRLGAYEAHIKKDTLAYKIYKKEKISERHRHRYEFNNKYKEILKEKGLVISASSPSGNLVEIIELNNHPFFIASQFHPEFKSKPFEAHPIFSAFIKSCKDMKK